MTAVPDLSALSHAEKDTLILALFDRLAAAKARTAALEARIAELTRPPKTPDNSSKPPSTGQKPNAPQRRSRRRAGAAPARAARCTRTPTA